ncbi:MAG TPA: hypothetical protein VJY39_11005 [Acidisphaera sp.]|nr:hypothetical protein [Acidisphaera sp.]
MSATGQTRALDLADIQGNIVRPYGRFGFPIARQLFFHVGDAAAGRRFVGRVRHAITSAQRWRGVDDDPGTPAPPRPPVAINIGLSFLGLLALGLPTRTLSNMPDEFIDGMAKRWSILGDIDASAPDRWDPIWTSAERPVHIWVSLCAQAMRDGTPVPELAAVTKWLRWNAVSCPGVSLLEGHRGPTPEYQDACARMETLPDGTVVPTAQEHFGFIDAIADPTFVGQYEPQNEDAEVIGGGKLVAGAKPWGPLATGEFILGHPSEAQELPPSAAPWSFMRNGTFMAYRKLHENLGRFQAYIAEQASAFVKLGGAPSEEAARETVMAKMAGRWRSGIPLAIADTYERAQEIAARYDDIPAIQRAGPNRTAEQAQRLAAYERLITDFRYKDDIDGLRCPIAAHIRRVNPRDALDPTLGSTGAKPTSALTNRRRILRRGLPYGDGTQQDDESEHGVLFLAACTSLFRQFEFMQQQWVQYGSSFGLGNDTDPLVGLKREGAKFVIPAASGAPFICAGVPQFVERAAANISSSPA